MVRNVTRAALVLLAVVSVAGLPTVGFWADAGGATGHAAASGPLTTEVDFTTTELLTTTELVTTTDLPTTTEADSTTTTAVESTTTTEETTATTSSTSTTTTATTTSADDSLVETTTVADSVTNGTDEVANETEDATGETEDAVNETEDAVNETEDAVNETEDAVNETDELANTTGEVTNGTDDLTNTTEEATNETGELTNATGDSLAVVTSAPTDVLVVSTDGPSVRLSVTGTSSLVSPTTDSLADTATSLEEGDDEKTTRSASGGTPAEGDGTATGGDETTATARGSGTPGSSGGDSSGADSSGGASGGDSSTEGDAPPDRPNPGTSPPAPELAAGVGALTAAALLPHLADAFALAGNAGLVSASSAFVGPTAGVQTRIRRGVRSRFDRFWRFVAPFRYSRWDDSDPLDHEGREALYEAIERSPGAYLSAVCESADVPVSTARHHLDVLEDEGLVTTAKVRGKRRFYPGRGEDAELVAALEDEGTAPVLHALARLGDAHGGLLADELDRDPSTVSHHLSRLEDAGLVEREREGRAVVNRLVPEVKSVLCGDEGTTVDEETEAEADDETDPESEAETPAVAD